MNKRSTVFGLVVLAVGLMGDSCPFDGKPGLTVDLISNPDERCVELADEFPASIGIVDNATASMMGKEDLRDLVWVGDNGVPGFLPIDATMIPPVLSEGVETLPLGNDIDGNNTGQPDRPAILGPFQFDGTTLLATITGYEQVLPLDLPPTIGTPALPQFVQNVEFRTEVPSGTPADYPAYPNFAGGSETRTAISTLACVIVPIGPGDDSADPPVEIDRENFPNSYDSLDEPIGSECAGTSTANFLTSETVGMAVVGTFNAADTRYFAATRNLSDAGDRLFPGTVLVYEQFDDAPDGTILSPHPDTPVIFTTGYNPSGIGAYATTTDNFVVVAVAGEIAFISDDPDTEDVVEGGFAANAALPASIDVIDASHPENGIIATYPLGAAGLSPGLQIAGDVAVAGSLVGRNLHAVDLSVLETFSDTAVYDPASPPTTPIDLTGSLLNAGRFALPSNGVGGPDPATCAGQIFGLAFNDNGDKLFATDFCSGVISEVLVNPTGFSNGTQSQFFTAIDTEDLDSLRGVTGIALRPGVPTDAGADAFVLVSQPQGYMCAVELGAN